MEKNGARSFIVFIIVLIAAAIVIVGGYLILHRSTRTVSGNTNISKTTSTPAPSVNNAVLTTKTESKLGRYLADPSGKPLYTHGSEGAGVSNCMGPCLSVWLPYVDNGSTSNLPAGVGTIKRADNGQIQFTYNGMPLYYFASDGRGGPTGDGISGFALAKPLAATSTKSSSMPSKSMSNNSGVPAY